MKKYLYIGILILLAIACKKETNYSKTGVSLPTVNGLSIQQTDTNKVKLAWSIPAGLPAEITQPISVNVQVAEIISPTRSIIVASQTLANAPLSYDYVLPSSKKTYHFIVKLFGTTKSTDKNYSNTIYSLGQTVIYQK